MQITIFKEITTAKVLSSFAEKSESYTGLHVDMEDPEQRRFVKKQAEEINGILKKLDRARIDKTKASKASIDDEFNKIVESLSKSNEPFTLLINEYKAERKRILDEEKRVAAEKEAYYQMGIDHQEAINENELHDLRKEKQAREQAENEKKLLAQAEADKKQTAIDAEAKRIKDVEQAKIDTENRIKAEQEQAEAEAKQREADTEHTRNVMTNVKQSLMQCNITEDQARTITLAIKNGQIFNTFIKF